MEPVRSIVTGAVVVASGSVPTTARVSAVTPDSPIDDPAPPTSVIATTVRLTSAVAVLVAVTVSDPASITVGELVVPPLTRAAVTPRT